MPDTPILNDNVSVADLAEELSRHSVIAVDLEADSMHCYQEKVCLLQFTTSERTVLLDPLAVSDLTPLKPVFADASVRKIFHAADYDIRCLNRDFDLEIRGLFDTMIASQFLGEKKVGLADMLGKYYDVTLDKKYQRADWSQRPLDPGMIRYAAEDTRHLHKLAQLLEGRLVEKGRLSWVSEEFALLEQVRFSNAEGPFFLRLKGAGALSRRQLAILESLLQWRDSEARRRDRPPFKVIGNRQLLSLAQHAPMTQKAMLGLDGLFPRIVDRHGRTLIKLIEEAKELPEDQLPVFPRGERRRRDPEVDKRLGRLKDWRKEMAAQLEMDPGIVINNALLEALAYAPPKSLEALAAVEGLKNWQRRELGEAILRVLAAGD